MDVADKIRRYCEYQDRSEWEVRRKMAQLLVPEEQRDDLMQDLIENKYVDDGRFTENFIRGRISQKRWGRIKIKMELLKHGISPSLIEEKMGESDNELYMANLHYLAERWKRENPDGDRPKMLRHLLGKGYTMDEIAQIK